MFRPKKLWLLVALALGASRAHASGPPIIFFDSGSAELSTQADAVLDGAITWLRAVNAEKIRVEASADRAGSASINLALSRRRGDAVKAALIRRGFPPDRIEVLAWGETRPIIETPDGVAERQNRYVLIMIETMGTTPR